MERQHLVAALAGCMNPDHTVRQAAEHALQSARAAPGQLLGLLHVSLDPGMDPAVRQVAAIAFKNSVKEGWGGEDEERPALVGPEEKGAVRDAMFAGLVAAPGAVKRQLRESARTMVYADYPAAWPGLLNSIGEGLVSQDQARLDGALSMLRLIARKYEFKDDVDRLPLVQMVQATFPLLLPIFQSLLSSDSASLELAELLKLICKVYWSSTYMEIPELMTHPDAIRAWMSCFQTLIMRPLPLDQMPSDPDSRDAWQWWKTKKWALHIAYRMFNRYGTPDMCTEAGDVAFATVFRRDWALPLLRACLHELSGVAAGQYIAGRVCNMVLQYLTQALAFSHTWKELKVTLPSLLPSVIFPMLCFSESDAELWQENPHEYIRKGYDIIEDLHSTKTAAMNFLLELCKSRPKGNLDALVQHMVGILGEFRAAGPGADLALARRADGACLAIGTLSEVLKQKARYAASLEPMLLQHVVPLFDSPHGHLRAKACWLAGAFADISFQDGQGKGPTFTALLHRCVRSIADPELPVRIDASVAVRAFLEAVEMEDLPLFKDLVPSLLTQFLQLSQEIDNEDLTFSLETVVERFSDEMAPYALGLTTHLTQQFWRIVSEEDAAGAGEEEDDEGALAAYGVLRTLSTILDSVSGVPELYPQLEELVFPVLHRYTSTDGQDVFEEIMQIITYLTFYGKAISPRMWSLYPRMLECLNEWAIDYFEEVLMPLDNYISQDTETFLNTRDPDLLALTNQTLEKVLAGDGYPVDQVVCAPRLMGVVLQTCRGRVDACVAPYLGLILRRLARGDADEDLHSALLVAAADALYYSPALALRALAAQPGALAALFGALGKAVAATRAGGRMAAFPSRRDKKLLALGLTAVLSTPEADTPPEIASAVGQLAAAVVRLLLAVKRQEEEAAGGGGAREREGEDAGAARASGDEADSEGADGDEANTDSDDDRVGRYGATRGDSDVSDSEEDWWSDGEAEVSSPVDAVDPFIYFGEVLGALGTSQPQRVAAIQATMDEGTRAAIQGMTAYAAQLQQEKLEAAAAAAAAH
uniref:Importin N-terminal domain-containing protein n=1 Tax=Auxenochlorella protothecoides TaxID=3075 RepID=A0A1D2AD30_AUXPR